ncbi:MAG: phosphopantetheine-binding protein [Planctomycetaceae bacterium]|nr:phosphopantetheine-binding protein [Planctomycetaceae bacterium]
MTSDDISNWIRTRIAKDIEKDASEVDPEVTFDQLGIDSLALLGVLGDLAAKLEIEIETSVLFDHPTIASLSVHLASD